MLAANKEATSVPGLVSRSVGSKKKTLNRLTKTFAATSLLAFALTACSSDDWANTWTNGGGQGYVSEDGRILEIPAENRADAVEFGGTLDTGEEFSSAELAGKVSVLNYWYAACPPCRLEAADLVAVHEAFADQEVAFYGVNVRDQAPQALAFAETYKVTYPSIMDLESGTVQLAFAGVVPPNAVPTTLVLDKEGKVASRMLGLIDPSILKAVISELLAETPIEESESESGATPESESAPEAQTNSSQILNSTETIKLIG